MSLLNGLATLGTGINAFAGNAAADIVAPTRTPLLSQAAPQESTAPATPPPVPRSSALRIFSPPPQNPMDNPLGKVLQDMFGGGTPQPQSQPQPAPNPYGDNPHAPVLWLAEQAIKGPESGGKADAQNPVSSAGGLFQITNGTFSSALQKMGILPPSSQTELNALKYNPDLNTKVMRQINVEAAGVLDAQGLPVTVNTLQAAHRLGPGGAAEAIKAAMTNPNAPLVGNGLASDAVKGNGDISHLTVGQFLASPYPRSGG